MSKNKKAATAAIIIAAALWVIASSSDQGSRETRQYSAPEPSVAVMSVDARQMASDTIELEIDVLDASISQEGEKLALAIIVLDGTSEARAKELGDNFVRLAKTFGPDNDPSQEIGRGRYDYLVGIRSASGSDIAMGAKIGSSPRITW